MKKRTYFILIGGCLFAHLSFGQIIDPKQTAKQKSTDRVNSRIDQGIDKGLDKVEGLFKKKEKKPKNGKKDENSDENTNEDNSNGNNSNGNNSNGNNANGKNSGNGNSSAGNQTPSFKTYSKFDFVPGEKVIAFDDFATTSVGDFPLGWNTNSTAEIVTIDGDSKKWLFISSDGFFQPEYVKDMPENFTLEFDVLTRYASNNILKYSFYLSAVENPRKDLSNKYIKDGIYFGWQPCAGESGYIVYANSEEVSQNAGLSIAQFESQTCSVPIVAKVSIWRQKTRLRMYVNETKVLDIPQAFDAKLKYNTFKFGSAQMNFSNGRQNDDEFMVSSIRYAVGAPDMRSKLITDGKLVTRGITFDVGSDKIKPESFGVLKEIAQVLSENPTVKVKIIGHTDSDGNAASNLELSKKRAAAVSKALTSDFKIDASRMQTDGKGAAEPSEPNATPQGKANNRRVEFVKL